MKAQQSAKAMALAALLIFVAAVFQIASDRFWIGLVFIGAGACLSAAAASYRKKAGAETKDADPRDHA
jgi:hypothetical protein